MTKIRLANNNAYKRSESGGKKMYKDKNSCSKAHNKIRGHTEHNSEKLFLTPSFSKATFSKSFWMGPPGSACPDEELKLLRKSLGILVKGSRLDLCPPPIQDLTNSHLPAEALRLLNYVGFKTPSAIQMQAWPAILSGSDLLGVAPTGSGKTLAYVLPMVPHILARIEPRGGSELTTSNKSSITNSNTKSNVISPMALVIVPTRELCIQVEASLRPLTKLFKIRSSSFYGGTDKDSQVEQYKRIGGSHIIVCTPGRLVDCISAHSVRLDSVTYLVVDEADRMLAFGFADQLDAIMTQIRPERQTILFSASFPGTLRDAASRWMQDEIFVRCGTIEVRSSNNCTGSEQNLHEIARIDLSSNDIKCSTVLDSTLTVDGYEQEDSKLDSDNQKSATTSSSSSTVAISQSITQHVHVCSSHKKPRLLLHFINQIRQAEIISKTRHRAAMLIFCNKIKTVRFVMDFLQRHPEECGVKAGVGVLHGSMPQAHREKALVDIRSGKTNTLISTDVCARGLHIKRLQFVINYDFPGSLEQYCHRIGRVGRQGTKGESYSMLTRNMAPLAPSLVKLLESCEQTVEKNLKDLAESVILLAEPEDAEDSGAELSEKGEEDGNDEVRDLDNQDDET